jgi:gamma-glutamyl phosphate reductase
VKLHKHKLDDENGYRTVEKQFVKDCLQIIQERYNKAREDDPEKEWSDALLSIAVNVIAQTIGHMWQIDKKTAESVLTHLNKAIKEQTRAAIASQNNSCESSTWLSNERRQSMKARISDHDADH